MGHNKGRKQEIELGARLLYGKDHKAAVCPCLF